MSTSGGGSSGGKAPAPPSAGAGKKKSAEPPPLPDGWDRCHAYNKGKRRYCRQMPLPPSRPCCEDQPRYCGNHRHLLEEWLASNEHHNGASDGGDCSKVKRQRTDQHPEIRPSNRSQKNRGRRVPCPVDPSHFVFESAVAKHVLVCPAAMQKREQAEKEYYCEGVNSGGFGAIGNADSGDAVPDLEEAKKLALDVLRVFHRVFLTPGGNAFSAGSTHPERRPNDQLQNITEQEIYDALPEMDLSAVEEGMEVAKQQSSKLEDSADTTSGKTRRGRAEMPSRRSTDAGTSASRSTGASNGAMLTAAIARHKVKAGGPRHLHQIASILGHVRQNGLMSASECEPEREPLVIEMGAGRGMTGLVVAGAMAVSSGRVKLCLVEKAGTRRKAETKARIAAYSGKHTKDECLRLDLVDITRVKCDLAHVDMSKALPPPASQSNSAKRVVVAKHLCGAGTDLALKSLRNAGAIDGCVMATCCHGLCTWTEYVGRDCFLRLFGSFGEKEFNLMKRWAPASVLDEGSKFTRSDSDDIAKEEHKDCVSDEVSGRYPAISAVVNEAGLTCGVRGLGRACQRLIDYGRCEYMRDELFGSSSSACGDMTIEMLHYTSRDVTPQNALLVASRHR